MTQANAFGTSESVFQYLNEGIRSGRWKPGDRLPSETQLCQELNISRTSVRSAIGRLSGLGLVQSRQGKGTFVLTPEHDANHAGIDIRNASLVDVYEFRKIIESESAALAAIRATSADIGEMEKTITLMADGETIEEVMEQDMLFHYLVARASGNEVIQGVFNVTHDTYENMFKISISQMHNDVVSHHRRILLAIQTRDMENARKYMLNHLEDTMRTVCGS